MSDINAKTEMIKWLVLENALPDWKGDRLIAALSKRYADCCILVFSHLAGDAAAESAREEPSVQAPPEAIVAAVRRVAAEPRALVAHIQTAQAIRAQGQETTAGVSGG